MVCMLFSSLPTAIFAVDNGASDIIGHWAEKEIKDLIDKKIIIGYEDGTVKPNGIITQAEIITLINRILKFTEKSDINFENIALNEWYAEEYLIAKQAGYLTENDYIKIDPNNPAVREDIALLLFRALGFREVDNEFKFNDHSSISSYALIAIYTLNSYGFFIGNENKDFLPQKDITRAEIFTVISRIINYKPVEEVSEEEEPTENKLEETSTAPNNVANQNDINFQNWFPQALAPLAPIKKVYNISFDLNYSDSLNGIDSQIIEAGENVEVPYPPLRDGYVLDSWYQEKECVNEFNFDTKPNKSMVLYAGWITEEEYYNLDTDGDKVANYLEAYFGSSNNMDDTDGDRLSDYVEIYILTTDPSIKDTDNNGITDDLEDEDEDGLTNYDEIYVYKTDPTHNDTDRDSLTDYDELFIYGTDPLLYDTDGDGISDKNELDLGLNPLEQYSDGVTKDSERTFFQKLSTDNVEESLLSSDKPLKPSISGFVPDIINNNMSIEEDKFSDFNDSRFVIGDVIKINTSYTDFSATLSFDYQNLLSHYDSDYINKLAVCYWDGTDLQLIDTVNSVETKLLNVTIQSGGIFFVMDVEEFLNYLGIEIPTKAPESPIAPVSMMYSSPMMASIDTGENANDVPAEWYEEYYKKSELEASENEDLIPTSSPSLFSMTAFSDFSATASSLKGQADIVFVIDTTGSMWGAISNVASNINSFVDTLTTEYNVQVNFALVDYRDITVDGINSTHVVTNGLSNWYSDVNKFKNAVNNMQVGGGGDTPETAIDGLAMANNLNFRNNVDKFVILVTDADYKINNNYGIKNMTEMASLLANNGINTSVISNVYDKNRYSTLYNSTGGIWANIYGNFSVELLRLADTIGEKVSDGEWVLLDSFEYVKLNDVVSPYNGTDSDKDDLLDYEELGELKTVNLTPWIEILCTLNAVPYEEWGGKTTIQVYDFVSHPLLEDTDFDGINDKLDKSPKNNSFDGKLTRYDTIVGIESRDIQGNISFNVDYRNFFSDNSVYNKDIGVLSSLYSANIYSEEEVEVLSESLLVGKHKQRENFAMTFGMKTVYVTAVGTKDNDRTDVIIGHRLVKYKNIEKEIILVVVRGTNGTFEEWSSNFDVGADVYEYYDKTNSTHAEWKEKLNHKGFDVTANRVKEVIDTYVKTFIDPNVDKCIWITGHSRGGAIANILGAYYENNPSYETYTYTFASPTTTTSYTAGNYNTIFNIINSDDLIPKLPLDTWGFKRYGEDKFTSVKNIPSRNNSFESIFKRAYNSNDLSKLYKSFSSIADNRKDLYKTTNNVDTLQFYGKERLSIEKAYADIEDTKKFINHVEILQFADFDIGYGKNILGLNVYQAHTYQIPAFFMQTLADIAVDSKKLIKSKLADKYEDARNDFVSLYLLGMEHPHYPAAYYIIATNDKYN
jgi:Lipase (class 3)./Listeria-Bacteroides repeat domain (List_Bact_rpt)./S-layer homology domain.